MVRRSAQGVRAQIMYRRSIVTFLDILGFRDIVRTTAAREILRHLRVFQNANRMIGEGFPKYTSAAPRVLQFSDSIVRVRPLELGESRVHTLTFLGELGDLARAQLAMIERGVVLRGAVTIGDVFVSRNGVFGPAFVRAYELETGLAKYPRIILDTVFLDALTAFGAADQDDGIRHDKLAMHWLSYGEDGVPWLDYFSWLVSMEWDSDSVLNYFIKHRDLILRNRPELAALDTVSAKYLWLAKYHNQSLLKLSKQHGEALLFDYTPLLIGNAEFPLFAQGAH